MSYANIRAWRADNGVVLEWHEGRNMDAHKEVFVTSGALIQRLDSLLDVFELDGLHVAPTMTIPASEAPIDLVQPESAASVAVDELLPPGTPRLEIGD
jgi:hypothetical protein